MSIGKNIKRLREAKGWSQETLAEKIGVTYQAISSWERDEYMPEMENFIRLTKVLDVPSTSILEDKSATFNTKDVIYNWEHMKTFVKTTAGILNMTNTLKALEFAFEAHKGQKRKKSETPYIYHPLNMACHALSMGIREDEVIAAILLHDVIEDCGKTVEEMPVNDETKELVSLMTKENADGSQAKAPDDYYGDIAENPKAALIKCIDRCNNMTTMSWGLTREGIYHYIAETEKYYPKLLKTVKDTPEYTNASWLLKYQIESMLDIYKRLM